MRFAGASWRDSRLARLTRILHFLFFQLFLHIIYFVLIRRIATPFKVAGALVEGCRLILWVQLLEMLGTLAGIVEVSHQWLVMFLAFQGFDQRFEHVLRVRLAFVTLYSVVQAVGNVESAVACGRCSSLLLGETLYFWVATTVIIPTMATFLDSLSKFGDCVIEDGGVCCWCLWEIVNSSLVNCIQHTSIITHMGTKETRLRLIVNPVTFLTSVSS